MNLMEIFMPRSEVTVLYDTYTLRQVMEKMEPRRYIGGLPMLDAEHHYIGTVTEGDLLWFIKSRGTVSIRDAEKISIRQVPLHFHTDPVSVNTEMNEVLDALMAASFVPVEDDRGCFIGIVTRKRALYAMQRQREKDASALPLTPQAPLQNMPVYTL